MNKITEAFATVEFTGSDQDTIFKVIDLTKNAKPTRNPHNSGVWEHTFLHAPHLLTYKAKVRIVENILNNRSPFSKLGRITDAALSNYSNR